MECIGLHSTGYMYVQSWFVDEQFRIFLSLFISFSLMVLKVSILCKSMWYIRCAWSVYCPSTWNSIHLRCSSLHLFHIQRESNGFGNLIEYMELFNEELIRRLPK